MSTTPWIEELEFAVGLAREAGGILMNYFGGSYAVSQKSVSRHDPVTEADLAADRLLREAIARRFPDDGWLSEETVDSPDRMTRSRVWIVDPLDGTKEFVQGLPEFALSLALVSDGRPVVGIIYNPTTEDLFAAAAGAGAFRNDTPIRVSPRSELAGARILASRSEVSRALFEPISALCSIRSVGSIAFKLALVAAGEGDITISLRPKSEWDVCAGVLIVQESGGVATDIFGRPLSFNRREIKVSGIIASNASLQQQSHDWIREHVDLSVFGSTSI